jgi:hypothetical protein
MRITLYLSSFGNYSLEPKEAPKDPKQDLYENRLRYTKERNLLLFAVNLVSDIVYNLNSPS